MWIKWKKVNILIRILAYSYKRVAIVKKKIANFPSLAIEHARVENMYFIASISDKNKLHVPLKDSPPFYLKPPYYWDLEPLIK